MVQTRKVCLEIHRKPGTHNKQNLPLKRCFFSNCYIQLSTRSGRWRKMEAALSRRSREIKTALQFGNCFFSFEWLFGESISELLKTQKESAFYEITYLEKRKNGQAFGGNSFIPSRKKAKDNRNESQDGGAEKLWAVSRQQYRLSKLAFTPEWQIPWNMQTPVSGKSDIPASIIHNLFAHH